MYEGNDVGLNVGKRVGTVFGCNEGTHDGIIVVGVPDGKTVGLYVG